MSECSATELDVFPSYQSAIAPPSRITLTAGVSIHNVSGSALVLSVRNREEVAWMDTDLAWKILVKMGRKIYQQNNYKEGRKFFAMMCSQAVLRSWGSF